PRQPQGGYGPPRQQQGGYGPPRQQGFGGPRPGGFGGPRPGGFGGPRPGGFGGPRPGGFGGPRRGPAKPLLVSREEIETIEKLYKTTLPLPNPDVHEVIGQQLDMKPSKVFFAINLIRQKMKLTKLDYPKRKLAVSPDQLTAIEALYEPYLPVPPIGIHKIISKQLRMDEWRVHVGIGLIRKNKNMPRWNEERDDLPPGMKEQIEQQKIEKQRLAEEKLKEQAAAREALKEAQKATPKAPKAKKAEETSQEVTEEMTGEALEAEVSTKVVVTEEVVEKKPRAPRKPKAAVVAEVPKDLDPEDSVSEQSEEESKPE
ncbi:MAG: hypothetical protein K2X01_05290, partial [Cyanobacteria bacterium]|nr:hypothetical protein [Cyanobacteriota bacterium]